MDVQFRWCAQWVYTGIPRENIFFAYVWKPWESVLIYICMAESYSHVCMYMYTYMTIYFSQILSKIRSSLHIPQHGGADEQRVVTWRVWPGEHQREDAPDDHPGELHAVLQPGVARRQDRRGRLGWAGKRKPGRVHQMHCIDRDTRGKLNI